MKQQRFIDVCRSTKNEECPVVTLMMKKLNEKLGDSVNQKYYHAVTLKRSVLGHDSVTITLSDSRPKMDDTTMGIPLSELSDYESGKSVLLGVEYRKEREEWSLGDNMCYYLIFN